MAASASTACVVAGSRSLDLSTLSSKNAFGSSNNVVQGAPLAKSTARVAGIRASSKNSEEARPARREVLASLLVAGAALGFSGQSSAAVNPIGDVQNTVEDATSGIQRRIDGLFGKGKPYPAKNTQVTGNGAVADAKARVGGFLNKSQNPLATNIDKTTKEAASVVGSATGPNSASARAGKEFLGKDSTRVDEATARVNAGADKLQGKAVQAFDDAKGAVGGAVGAASDAAPDVEVQAPGAGLFKSLGSKIDEVKGNLPGQ